MKHFTDILIEEFTDTPVNRIFGDHFADTFTEEKSWRINIKQKFNDKGLQVKLVKEIGHNNGIISISRDWKERYHVLKNDEVVSEFTISIDSACRYRYDATTRMKGNQNDIWFHAKCLRGYLSYHGCNYTSPEIINEHDLDTLVNSIAKYINEYFTFIEEKTELENKYVGKDINGHIVRASDIYFDYGNGNTKKPQWYVSANKEHIPINTLA
jgi:hypothetical protein